MRSRQKILQASHLSRPCIPAARLEMRGPTPSCSIVEELAGMMAA
jgi:hypothetical protein